MGYKPRKARKKKEPLVDMALIIIDSRKGIQEKILRDEARVLYQSGILAIDLTNSKSCDVVYTPVNPDNWKRRSQ